MSTASTNCISKCFPIQDQGDCGSCTGFGTTGGWEPFIGVKLSEKDLFFCGGGSCEDGADMDQILNQACTGVCTEKCDPYDASTYDGNDSSCGSGRCINYIVGQRRLSSAPSVTDVIQMKALLNTGPLVTTMECHQSFLNYVSGVYHNLGASDPIVGGHCVAIVGYDDLQGAWLLRNSWSTDWGQGCTVDGQPTPGYCWIAYGDSQIDTEMYQLIPAEPTPIEVTASDPEDTFGRYWEAWVDQAPGNYLGNGKYANPADFSSVQRSGKTVTYDISAYGQHTLYFVVTQSGGSKFGTYSGTVTVSGKATPFSGVDCNHPAEVPFFVT
jgi:hypothetical protein